MHLLVLGAFWRPNTQYTTDPYATGLNAPDVARCFLTHDVGERMESRLPRVLKRHMALSAFWHSAFRFVADADWLS